SCWSRAEIIRRIVELSSTSKSRRDIVDVLIQGIPAPAGVVSLPPEARGDRRRPAAFATFSYHARPNTITPATAREPPSLDAGS
ncbi:MAG: hypothetical protein JO034_09500, partial [Singulisphaera sp.]|nr:hypothetical protein [Singulisphaera sp.]